MVTERPTSRLFLAPPFRQLRPLHHGRRLASTASNSPAIPAATNAPAGPPTAATSSSNPLAAALAKFGPCSPTAPLPTNSPPPATTNPPTGPPANHAPAQKIKKIPSVAQPILPVLLGSSSMEWPNFRSASLPGTKLGPTNSWEPHSECAKGGSWVPTFKTPQNPTPPTRASPNTLPFVSPRSPIQYISCHDISPGPGPLVLLSFCPADPKRDFSVSQEDTQ